MGLGLATHSSINPEKVSVAEAFFVILHCHLERSQKVLISYIYNQFLMGRFINFY